MQHPFLPREVNNFTVNLASRIRRLEWLLPCLQGLRAARGRVQFIVGQNDSYWKKGSEGWHQRFLNAGMKSTLEIIPNGEHVMPEIKGKPIFDRLDSIATEVKPTTSSD